MLLELHLTSSNNNIVLPWKNYTALNDQTGILLCRCSWSTKDFLTRLISDVINTAFTSFIIICSVFFRFFPWGLLGPNPVNFMGEDQGTPWMSWWLIQGVPWSIIILIHHYSLLIEISIWPWKVSNVTNAIRCNTELSNTPAWSVSLNFKLWQSTDPSIVSFACEGLRSHIFRLLACY